MQLSEYLHDNIGRHVSLRQSGAYFVGICPFHKEDTPSFTVNPGNNTFHCFGCGAHGHAEDFELDLSRAKGMADVNA